jgi:hypothetical protein
VDLFYFTSWGEPVMQDKDVKAAIVEAKRFVDRAVQWLALDNQYKHISGTKEGGAMRRASMDLTRALAQMRKY